MRTKHFREGFVVAIATSFQQPAQFMAGVRLGDGNIHYALAGDGAKKVPCLVEYDFSMNDRAAHGQHCRWRKQGQPVKFKNVLFSHLNIHRNQFNLNP